MTPIDTVSQKGHSSYQKYHLAKMASHNYIIDFLKYYQHHANRTYPYN